MENKKFITHRIVSKSRQILLDTRSKQFRASGVELVAGDSVEIALTKITPQKPQESATEQPPMPEDDGGDEGAI